MVASLRICFNLMPLLKDQGSIYIVNVKEIMKWVEIMINWNRMKPDLKQKAW